jgi:cytoskeletal protein CcmA (bactofilin family)
MGIKENFTQAVKELTGGGKDDKAVKTSQVEDLRRAVETEALDKPAPAPEGVAESPSPVTFESFEDFEARNMASAPYYPQKPAAQVPVQPTAPAEPQQAAPLQAAMPQFAPKSSHAGLDVSVQELKDIPEMEGSVYQPPPQSMNMGNVNVEPSPVGGQFPQNFNAPNTSSIDDAMNDELTVISKNTVVEGNIRSFANMNIDGNIRGDIETTKNIELNGKVIGNLTCNNAQMQTSQIQGNIRMKGNILMGRDTLLIGDLVSTYAKVNGKVKGNMEVGGKAELKGDAVIFGDISASTITVDDGAIIQGYVSTTFLNKEESKNIFPEAISIAE